MAFNRPISIGDIIESNGIKGKVVTLNLRDTQIRSDSKDTFDNITALFLQECLFFVTSCCTCRKNSNFHNYLKVSVISVIIAIN
ncbi:mechanosensitive ion channel domain-containing protein [Flavobacterium cerinum]|uniref:mechanosensitive ion channel domain-containing protein n=1 Tax=Flavobacterium cerinum TaxID=2502784 RepID=UPI001F4F8212|nr:mechanosensitive ion channel domain-containing protein [Flavobacterium cerinum]